MHPQAKPHDYKNHGGFTRAYTHARIQTKMLLVLGRLAELAVLQQERDKMSIARALDLVTAQFVLPLVEEEEEDRFHDMTLGDPGVGRSGVNTGEKEHATPSIRERERHKHVVALSVFASRIMEGVLGGGGELGVERDGRHVARLALISVGASIPCLLLSVVVSPFIPLSSPHPLDR